MASGTSNAPSWLFSFVDLAFLLLIAMTQVGGSDAPDLGEIVVPRFREEAARDLAPGAQAVWQLRIHPPDPGGPQPFELVQAAGGVPVEVGARLDVAALSRRLQKLRGAGEAKPLLAPHENSRSQDLLDALGLVEEHWPSRRRVLVAPVLASR